MFRLLVSAMDISYCAAEKTRKWADNKRLLKAADRSLVLHSLRNKLYADTNVYRTVLDLQKTAYSSRAELSSAVCEKLHNCFFQASMSRPKAEFAMGHRLYGSFKILRKDESGMTVKVFKKGAVVRHKEHKPVKLPKGEYEFYSVQEYDHFEEEARRIAD